MTFGLIANVGGTSTGGASVTTAAIDTTGANLIVINISGAGFSAPSDSKGNTWTLAISEATNPGSALWYCSNPTVGSGHTFTSNNGGQFPTIEVQAWSGAAASSPLDQTNKNSNDSGTLQSGSVTPSQDNELVVTGQGNNAGSGTPTINAGFTITNGYPFTSGNFYGGGMADLVQTTAGAVNPTWTTNAINQQGAVIATFKAAAAASYLPYTPWPQLGPLVAQ